MPPNADDISRDQIDLSDTEFWAGPLDIREATINGIKRLACAWS
ncbi:MAG: hypothetical protein ACI9N0_001684 [Ilumatobacter sp.]|jgi:hypothetical protein